MSNLALVTMKTVAPGIPVLAMYENEAAKSIRLNRTNFRKLVDRGLIPYTFHADGKRRIYLLADIHAYLNGREKFTMIHGNSPANFSKGKQ